MDRKKKIIIIALIVIAIILLALILWFLFGPKNLGQVTPQPGSNPKLVTAGKATAVLPVSSPTRVAEEKKYPLGLKQLALSFAERYGSYSTDQRFKNLDDLKLFMTDKMQKTVSDSIQAEMASTTGGETFQGITTRGLSADLVSVDTVSAVVVVETQRTISTGDEVNPTVAYKKIKLSFIKFGNEWKVDDALWQ